ncbi:hypothetical protein PM10SUCC1_02350 [Propionigenium maris DSM 9537]|uniref:Uncharacterized protein n=1 Tax=Propionigenium maris DSM 9537 TaxID=1123000 RepID=A0A9W6GIS0_9FUSO|nr:hypothetical protein [Propionigenium maris]GLI54720.1 hypothetical protein PM10SUCC1_02350 [Propionigenium maris DSM 9537]
MRELIFIFPSEGKQSKNRMIENYIIPYIKWSARYGFDFPVGEIKYIDEERKLREASLDLTLLDESARKVYEEKMKEKPERCFYLVPHDRIFEGISETWRRGELSELSSLGGNPERIEILSEMGSYIDSHPEFKEFFWSHLADTLLYKFLPEVRDLVVHRALDLIVSEISKNYEKHWKGINVSLIGHGMGTGIASDLTEEYYRITHSRSKERNRYPVVNSLVQISNISHLMVGEGLNLSRDNPRYNDLPSRAGVGCERYSTYGHRGDILTLDGMEFAPERWERSSYTAGGNRSVHLTGEVLGGRAIEDMEVMEITERLHSFEHYVSNPEILLDLIKRMDTFRYWGSCREDLEKAMKIYKERYVLREEDTLERILREIDEKGIGELLKKLLAGLKG